MLKKIIISLLLSSILLSVFLGCADKKNTICDDTSSETQSEIEEDTAMKMKYDDRYIFDKDISQITTISVTSKIINTDKSDECVLKIVDEQKNRKVIAVGVGTAEVTFSDGSKIQVKVEAADISMLLIIGQSNAEGQIQPDAGNFDANTYRTAIDQSILSDEGQVYSTYAPGLSIKHGNGIGNSTFTDTLSISNYEKFVASSLTSNINLQG